MEAETPPGETPGLDPGPVIGGDDASRTPQGPTGGGWMLVAALVVGAVLFVATGWSGPEAVDDTPSEVRIPSTTTTIDRPSVSVPPTAPEGELVDKTLEWETAPGLEEAIQIGGAARFDGAHWIAGSTEAGLVVWRAGEPQGPWELHSTIDSDAPAWGISDMAAAHGRLWVAAISENWREEPGVLYESDDGSRWVRHTLDSGDPDFAVSLPTAVGGTPEGVAVTGRITAERAHVEPPLDVLPASVQDLVEAGYADGYVVENEVRASVPPGLEIASVPLSDEESRPAEALAEPAERSQMWLGGSGGFRPYPQSTIPTRIEVRADGTLLGIDDSHRRLLVSEDGTSWQRMGPGTTDFIGAFAGWEGGGVVVTSRGGLEHWRDGSEERLPIFPQVLDQYRFGLSQVAAGEWGLAVTTSDGFSSQPAPRTMVADSDGLQLWLTGGFQIDLIRGSQTLWSRDPSNVEVKAEEGLRLRFGEGDDSVAVEAEVWVEAVGEGMGPAAATMSIAHTNDGQTWSVTAWDEVTDGPTPGMFHRLFDGGDFLLVVEQATYPTSQLRSVAVGISPQQRE